MLVTAAQVAINVAALMNDTELGVYTFNKILPYLNMACDDLQEIFELNNVPVTNESSFVFQINAGVTEIAALPPNLVEIQRLWERPRDNDPYVPMTKLDALPLYMTGAPTNMLIYWVWESQKIKFLPSNQDNDVKMEYIKSIFVPITSESDSIPVINAKSYLQYHTAALCSMYIGENETRAEALEGQASNALDRSLGISTKGQQSIVTRRRPFMARFKSRGVW